MENNKLKIEAWNPTFIGFINNPDHSKIEKKLVKHCLQLQKKIQSGGSNWISSQTYNTSNTYNILKDKNFKNLNDWITEQVQTYAKSLKYKDSFLCADGWFNIYNEHDYQEYHTHPDYTLSAIYFLKSLKNGSKTFFDTNPISDSNRPTTDINFGMTNRIIHHDPIPGKLLIFRSNVLHCVERNKYKDSRISLAYNFVKEK